MKKSRKILKTPVPKVGPVFVRKCIYVQMEIPFPRDPGPEERRSFLRSIISPGSGSGRKQANIAEFIGLKPYPDR